MPKFGANPPKEYEWVIGKSVEQIEQINFLKNKIAALKQGHDCNDEELNDLQRELNNLLKLR